MKDIAEIEMLDDKIHQILIDNADLIYDFPHNHIIPNTSKSLILFITKTNFIKTGIFDLYESENLYGINILFRSLIEHFLRFQYMYCRVLSDENDNIGEDYIRFCALAENIDTGKAWRDASKILSNSPTEDPYEVLKRVNKNYEKYSKEEILKKAEQFRYKNIIRYLKKIIYKDQTFDAVPFLLKIIPQYAELSSFVHGGPGSDHILVDTIPDEERISHLRNKLELTFLIANSVQMLTYLIFSQYDDRFHSVYLETQQTIQEFHLIPE